MPSTLVERDLSNQLWERVRPLIPPHRPRPFGGRPPVDDRACFVAIVYVLRSGCRWRDVPKHLPSASTCWRRHQAWTQAGVWEQVWQLLVKELGRRGQLDTSELFLDAMFVEARKGGSKSAPRVAAKG
jgi:transposase